MADSDFDPVELSDRIGQILGHTSAMLGVLNGVRADIEQLNTRTNSIGETLNTLRRDVSTAQEVNMRHDGELRALWVIVGFISVIVIVSLAIGIYAAMR